MQSALNYRQSRRSACDRCRGFKLRCERDPINGRSCERCLKAQVVCTTNIGHPSQGYISSKTSDCDGRVYGDSRLPLPILRKSSNSKIRKSTPSPSHPHHRRHQSQRFNTWPDSEPFPCLPMENMPCMQMNAYQNDIFPFDPWTVPEAPRLSNPNALHPQIEDIIFQPDPRLGSQISGPDYGLPDPTFQHQLHDDSQFDPLLGLCSEPFGLQVNDIPFQFPETKGSTVMEYPSLVEDSNCLSNPFKHRRRLLKLDLEMLDDLEFLEAGAMTMKYSTLKEDIAPLIGRLDLPIHRVLNHSMQLLELIQNDNSTFDQELLPGVSRTHQQSSPTESSAESLEDRATITSSVDSGYLSVNDMKNITIPRYEISTSLSMLSAHCHLLNVYHAIFSQLNQALMILPLNDAVSFLVLPSLTFGNAELDGSLASQMRFLIDLSSNFIEKIEHSLGISSSLDANTDSNAVVSMSGNNHLASVRNHVMVSDNIGGSSMLKDTMRRLERLIKQSLDA